MTLQGAFKIGLALAYLFGIWTITRVSILVP